MHTVKKGKNIKNFNLISLSTFSVYIDFFHYFPIFLCVSYSCINLNKTLCYGNIKKEVGRNFKNVISRGLAEWASLGCRLLGLCSAHCCLYLLFSLVPSVCLCSGSLLHRFLAHPGLPLIPTLPLLTSKFVSVLCGQFSKRSKSSFPSVCFP